jgi:hypothetical protein
MIHHLDMYAEQVRNIAGYIERQDLALAVGQVFVAADKTLDQQAALRRAISLTHDVGICAKVRNPDRQIKDRLPLVFRKRGDGFEFAD